MKIKQIGSNQTELTLNDGTRVLFSYQTPVASLNTPNYKGFQVTKTKYSKTTTKHINKWLRSYVIGDISYISVDQSVLDELVSSENRFIGCNIYK